jgi:hypothetical protein
MFFLFDDSDPVFHLVHHYFQVAVCFKVLFSTISVCIDYFGAADFARDGGEQFLLSFFYHFFDVVGHLGPHLGVNQRSYLLRQLIHKQFYFCRGKLVPTDRPENSIHIQLLHTRDDLCVADCSFCDVVHVVLVTATTRIEAIHIIVDDASFAIIKMFEVTSLEGIMDDRLLSEFGPFPVRIDLYLIWFLNVL